MCKTCFKSHNRIIVNCIDCQKELNVNKSAYKRGNGRCRSCAISIEKNKPEYKKIHSELARIQVLAQGGIPNAVKFKNGHTLFVGEKSPNWKGGITPKYQQGRSSKKYKDFRIECFKKDNYTCVICGSKEKIEMDHIKPYYKYIELRYDITNVRTLCRECHIAAKTSGWNLKHNPH